MQLRIKGTISQISLYNIKTDISGDCLSPVHIEDTQARFIKLRLLEWHDSPATGLTVMANNDVDGGAAPDLPARGRELFERPSDAEWARLESMIALARPGGRPRKTEMRRR